MYNKNSKQLWKFLKEHNTEVEGTRKYDKHTVTIQSMQNQEKKPRTTRKKKKKVRRLCGFTQIKKRFVSNNLR